MAAAAVCGLAAGPASAATRTVDDDGVQCKNPNFNSIQAAIDASGPNDQIIVCNGLYAEQLTIGAGKNGLKIRAKVTYGATIQDPVGANDVLIDISGSQNVELRRFNITGPFDGVINNCGARLIGIWAHGGASTLIRENRIRLIRNGDSGSLGCQQGIAVRAGSRALGETANVRIIQNTINGFQKAGIVIDGDGTKSLIDRNNIMGDDDNRQIAQNGIQISRGAQATVTTNTIQQLHYFDLNVAASTGLLMFEPDDDKVLVKGNNVFDTDSALALYDSDEGQYARNKLRDNVWGAYVDADSTGNLLDRNDARGNDDIDCDDDSTGSGTAGTANTWRKNLGITSDPAGICTP